MAERLQKILAQAGVASRRAAEQLILEGRVEVDGSIVTQLGSRFDPNQVRICVDGQEIAAEKHVYLLLNKPAGYISTLSDPQGRRLVTELLQDIPERVFPVGRLDFDTEGALILTNDGAFAHSILHPSREIPRTYEALVSGVPGPEALRRLESGLDLEEFRTRPAQVQILRRAARQCLVEIVIHEGHKRQVRRMFQAIGHRVLHLKRTAYGNLRLGNLRPGRWRRLSPAEFRQLFSAAP